MTTSQKTTIRLLLDAWRARGWRDEGNAAIAVVDAFAADPTELSSLAQAIPQAFLDANNVSRTEVATELERVLGHLHLDDEELASAPPVRLKILFFGASPTDQSPLRLDEEAREIEERLRLTDHRDVIDFVTKWAVRSSDLIEAVNRERPSALHFSGHGSANDELVLQDPQGRTVVVSGEAIIALIATIADEIRLVVFNNCYSERLAEEAAKYVEAAIGMNDSIGDTAARIFAANLYASLGYGRPLKTAFEQAKAALMLEGIPEDTTPQLFTRSGLDAAAMVLVAQT